MKQIRRQLRAEETMRFITIVAVCAAVAACEGRPVLEGNTAGQANYYVHWFAEGNRPRTCFITLEDWFDPARLRDDYAPTGRGPAGSKTRAVQGHEFGLDLSIDDRKALTAFLKTL